MTLRVIVAVTMSMYSFGTTAMVKAALARSPSLHSVKRGGPCNTVTS